MIQFIQFANYVMIKYHNAHNVKIQYQFVKNVVQDIILT